MTTPIPMILYCPKCGYQHIDEGAWSVKLHRTHLCLRCKYQWRPASVPTTGVLVLPLAPSLNMDEDLLRQEIDKAQAYFGYGADDNRWRPGESAIDALIRELEENKIARDTTEALAQEAMKPRVIVRNPLECRFCKVLGVIETGNVWNDRFAIQDTFAQWGCPECGRQGPYKVSSTNGVGEDFDPSAAYDAVYDQLKAEAKGN